MLEAIFVLIGLAGYIIKVIAVGFVIHDSYFEHRFNLKASILWTLFVTMMPLILGFPFYILFRPNRNIKNNIVEPNDIFLKKRYQVLDGILYILLLINLASVFFLFVKIIPIFAVIFKGYNIELPVLVRILFGISECFRKYFLIAVPLAGIFAILFFLIGNLKGKGILRKYFPASYVIAILLYAILPGLVVGLMIIGMFLPMGHLVKIK